MAADLQETLNKLVARYRNKVNQLFLIGMGLLLGLRLVLFLMDAGYTAPMRPEPEVIQIAPKLNPDSPEYQRVIQLTRPLPEFQESEFVVLGRFNMFDPKLVQQQAEIERRANERFNEALVSFRQGRLDEARRAVDEALGMQPSHARAKELRTQILSQLGIVPDAAPATTTATQPTEAPPAGAPATPPAPPAPAAAPPGAPPAAPAGAAR